MTIQGLFTLLRLLLLVSAALNAQAPSTETPANAAFVRLKSLAGEWQATGKNGEHSRLVYQVISGGSAVLERFSSDALPPNSGDMVTVYYIDRGELVLTHYCIAKNQPHMRTTRYDTHANEVDFDFVDGGNIATGNEGHMHSAKIRFIDENHLFSEWQYMEARSPKFKEINTFTRVK